MNERDNQEAESASPELLPCPMCGGMTTMPKISRGTYHYVCCDNCFLQIGPYDTPLEAQEAWNRRHPAVGKDGLPPLQNNVGEHERFVAWVDSIHEAARSHLTAWNGWDARAQLDLASRFVTELPPLPTPELRHGGSYGVLKADVYTAEQYRQGQRDAVAADRRSRGSIDGQLTGALSPVKQGAGIPSLASVIAEWDAQPYAQHPQVKGEDK